MDKWISKHEGKLRYLLMCVLVLPLITTHWFVISVVYAELLKPILVEAPNKWVAGYFEVSWFFTAYGLLFCMIYKMERVILKYKW